MRPAASTDRVPASLLPGCEESSEEENECSEHNPGKQSVIDPGHLRQCNVGVRGPSSVIVEMDIPRHVDNEGQARHAKPEYQPPRKPCLPGRRVLRPCSRGSWPPSSPGPLWSTDAS